MVDDGFRITYDWMRGEDSARVIREAEEMRETLDEVKGMRETLDEVEHVRRLAEIVNGMVQAQSNPPRVYTRTTCG